MYYSYSVPWLYNESMYYGYWLVYKGDNVDNKFVFTSETRHGSRYRQDFSPISAVIYLLCCLIVQNIFAFKRLNIMYFVEVNFILSLYVLSLHCSYPKFQYVHFCKLPFKNSLATYAIYISTSPSHPHIPYHLFVK